jgi:hypothetical protein
MTGSTDTQDSGYPRMVGMVVNGRWIEGICNDSIDTARLSASAGPHLPAAIQSKHFVEPRFKPRLVPR